MGNTLHCNVSITPPITIPPLPAADSTPSADIIGRLSRANPSCWTWWRTFITIKHDLQMSQEPDRIQGLYPSMVSLIPQAVPPVCTLRNRLEPEECCSNCKQEMLASEVWFYREHNPYNKWQMWLYYHFIAAAIFVAQYLKTTKTLIVWQGFVFNQ